MFKESISVCLPAYNEEKNIKEAVQNAYSFLTANFEDFEIIVVDDGSKDNTYQACLALKNTIGDVLKIFQHSVHKGYGAALRTGLFSAVKGLVFYTDADNQFDMRQVADFMGPISDHDAVIGYRQNRQDSFFRLFVSSAYNRLVNLLFGLKVIDVNCSFKLFRRERLLELIIEKDGFFADAELLIKAKLRGFKIAQLPVRHYPRKAGESKVKFSHLFATLSDMIGFYGKINKKT